MSPGGIARARDTQEGNPRNQQQQKPASMVMDSVTCAASVCALSAVHTPIAPITLSPVIDYRWTESRARTQPDFWDMCCNRRPRITIFFTSLNCPRKTLLVGGPTFANVDLLSKLQR